MTLDYNPNPVLDAPPTEFRWPEAAANPAPRPEPEHRWEGPMHGTTGSARHLHATLVVTLSLRGGEVRGHGFSDPWPYDCPNGDRRVAMSGTCAGDAIQFDLTFPTSHYFRNQHYPFTGTVSADGREIRGTWTYQCDECTCGGSTGTLHLTRIED